MRKRISAAFFALILLFLASCAPTVTEGGAESTSAPAFESTNTDTKTESSLKEETESGTAESADTDTESEAAERTEKVTVRGQIPLDKGRMAVYGTCEDGSVLTVSADFTDTFTVRSDGEHFIFEVSVPNSGKTEHVSITARVEGKSESDAVQSRVRYDRNADNTGVIATLGSRLVESRVLPDLYVTDPFTKSELSGIAGLAKRRLSRVRAATGKDTELIYVIVPNPLTVYPEEWTDEMKSGITENVRHIDSATEALSGIDGVTVINLESVMLENKESGKLYCKLDSHWTELGAYYGYAELMGVISEKFPAAKPHPLDDYDIRYVLQGETDMSVYAGVDENVLFESIPFLFSKYEPHTKYDSGKKELTMIWDYVDKFFRKTSVSRIDDPSLPSAMFIFDSYGLNMIAYTAEHFSTFVTQPVWKYGLDYSTCSREKPDYIIQVIAERSLDVLLTSE